MNKKISTVLYTAILAFMALSVTANDNGKLALKLSAKGDFAADNGKIFFYRWLKKNKAAYTQRYRLEFNLKWIMGFCGPQFRPYLGKMAQKMKIEESVDLAAGSVTDRGAIPNSAIGYSRTARESAGGILFSIKLNHDCFSREAKYAFVKWIFNGDKLKGKKILWGDKTITLPKSIKNGKILKASKNSANTIRISLSDNVDIGIVFIDGFTSKAFYQHKSKRNMPEIKKVDSVFELNAVMSGLDARYFAILLHPSDKIPAIKDILAANKPKAREIRKGNLLNQGSSFETGPFDGFCSFNRYSFRAPLERFKPYPQPKIVSDTAKDGNHSLYLTTPGRFGVVFNPHKLELGRQYTLSMWMKAEKPKTGVNIIIGLKGEQIKKSFTLNTKWKRYSFTFTPKKFVYMGHCQIRITNRKGHDGSFWLDAVQLEEGKLTNYAPAAKLEMGAAVLNKYRLVKAGEPSIVSLYFRNNTDKPAQGKVSYVVKDYWEKPVRTGNISVKTIPAQGNSSQILDLGKLPRGYYRAYFTASWGEKEEVIWGIFKPQKLEKVSTHWPFGAHDVFGEDILIRQLGFGWMRARYGWRFRDLMPKPGMKEMDFTRANHYVRLADKAAINLMPILEMCCHKKTFTSKYGWIKCWWLSGRASTKRHRKHGFNKLPDLKLWKKYISECIGRYKGKVNCWEITNESNTNYGPKDYYDLLRIAYTAGKKANPDCEIIGICSTSDMGGEPLPYTRKVLELGGWKYLDAVSIHVYGDRPPEIHFGGEDKLFRMIKNICAKHGKKIEVWNTEKNSASITGGYSEHKFNVPPVQHYHQARRIPTFKDKGEYFIREGIISSSVGNGPFFWHCFLPNNTFIGFITFKGPYMHGANYFEFDMAPRPELIAVNGFTSLLDPGMSGAGTVDWGDFNRCSLFASKGGTVSAVWNWKTPAAAEIPVKGNKYKLYNYFGEPINIKADKNGILRVNLESAPKYLVLPELPPEKASKLLDASAFPGGAKFDVSAKLIWKNNSPALETTARNLTKNPLDIKLEIKTLPGKWSCKGKQSKSQNAAAGKSINIYFGPLKIAPLPEGGKIILSAKAEDQEKDVSVQLLSMNNAGEIKAMLDRSGNAVAENRTSKPVKIDGDLKEWENSPAVWITDSRGDRNWKDVNDASCRLALGWDKNYLYFAARVFDDKISNMAKGNNMLWNGDAIELFFNFDFADDKSTEKAVGYRMNKDDFHATLAPETMKGPKAAVWWKYLKSNGNSIIISKHLPNGYIIEGAIPWKSLNSRCPFIPGKGKLAGFTFILCDRDGEAKIKKRLVWHGDQGVNRSPNTWGKVIFK